MLDWSGWQGWGSWGDWALTTLGAMAGGLVILYLVGGYYHLRYYVLRRDEPETWKIQEREPRPGHQWKAALSSSRNLAIGGFITGTLIHCMKRGLETPIYFDVADYGWAYTLGSTALLFVVIDGLAYYVHRSLHYKPLFRTIHRHHHVFVATTPWVVVAMHPVEFLMFQAVTFVPLFVIPTHVVSAVGVFIYIFVFNIIDHSGVRLRSRLPWQGPSMFHDDHHAHFHCNFGQHLMLWDRLHHTLRREGRRYGRDVFGGKGAGSGDAEFVKY